MKVVKIPSKYVCALSSEKGGKMRASHLQFGFRFSLIEKLVPVQQTDHGAQQSKTNANANNFRDLIRAVSN